MNVTFKGQPVTLKGTDLQTGDKAPDFTLVSNEMQPVTLEDVTRGGTRNALLIVVPSLDTGVCSLESQKFNARIGELPADVTAFVVSRDLPFAQARWAKDQGDVKLRLLSDYRFQNFGPAYGVLIEELGLLARSVFIVGKDKTILYKQVAPEVTQEPDYEDVIAAAHRTSSAVNA
jgi:thioredoxin-dependent peroxiredoxin